MVSLLLPVIYLAFISLGLPDSLLGSAWPVMYQELGTSVSAAGIISMIISAGTIVSSLNSDRLNTRFGTGKVTAVSVLTTAVALFGFSISHLGVEVAPHTPMDSTFRSKVGSISFSLSIRCELAFTFRHSSKSIFPFELFFPLTKKIRSCVAANSLRLGIRLATCRQIVS